MSSKATIELPRHPDESARAYAARVEYVTMGPGRDLRTLAQKLDKSLTLVGRWSSQYDWVKSAEEYDNQVAYLTVQEAAEAHRADLAAHRKKAMDAGQALYAVAGQLIKTINAALANPRRIEGKDGKVYVLHAIDITSSTFAIAARAMTTALDLEAHALGVDTVLGKLDNDSE